MTFPRTADECRDLLRQSREPESDVKIDVVQTHPQKFMVSFFTAIDISAKYLLAISSESESDPHFKLVAGSVLLTCVTRAGGLEKSLQTGIYKYLKQYGEWVGFKSLRVKVYKFDSAAIFEAEYEVKDEKVQ